MKENLYDLSVTFEAEDLNRNQNNCQANGGKHRDHACFQRADQAEKGNNAGDGENSAHHAANGRAEENIQCAINGSEDQI